MTVPLTPTGDDRPRHCAATGRTGRPCARPAGWGTPHPGYGRCKLHGGSTPNHCASARREYARDAARVLGLPIDIDPVDAIGDELARTTGAVHALGALVQALPEDDTLPGSPILRLWRDERRHLVRVCRIAIRAGIEHAPAGLPDETADAIRGILDDLSLSPEQTARTPEIMRRHLTGP